MLTGVSINKALIRKKQQPLCGLGGAWGENTNSEQHPHLQSWWCVTKGPASHRLLQSPLFPHTVTVQWTHRWPVLHITRARGCLVRLPAWVCTAAGLWDFTMINSSRGSSPPSELEKMEGKEGEWKSAEKSEKEKRTTLRWGGGERVTSRGNQCELRLFDGLLYPWPLPNLLSFYRSLSFLSLEDNKDGWHWCCAIRHYSPRLQSHLHHHLSPSLQTRPPPRAPRSNSALITSPSIHQQYWRLWQTVRHTLTPCPLLAHQRGVVPSSPSQ